MSKSRLGILLIVTVGLLLGIQGGIAACKSGSQEERIADYAQGWLELLDRGQYVEASGRLAPAARGGKGENAWREGVEAQRGLFGEMKERVRESITQVPRAGVDGSCEYVVEFSTSFKNAVPVVERVKIVETQHGDLTVSAYVTDESRVFENTAKGYLRLAESLYRRGDRGQAVKFFEEALRLEMKAASLDEALVKVLIDDMASAYGEMKSYDRSLEVIKYGQSRYPEYPIFYYNEACIAAERGASKSAIKLLSKAFELRNGVLPGEKMPDPRADSSFAALRDDPEFVKLTEGLYPK